MEAYELEHSNEIWILERSFTKLSDICSHVRSKKSCSERDLDDEVDYNIYPKQYNPSLSINRKIALHFGDITQLEVDAIVNAARPSLLGGGGIDKAIHKNAGPDLLEECKTLGGCKHGETKVTKGYKLPCKYILHTVGPNRDLHDEKESSKILELSYKTTFQRVEELGIKSVALSCVSTGAYRYPNREAAHIALRTVREWIEVNADKVDLIIFCIFMKVDLLHYCELLPVYFPQKE